MPQRQKAADFFTSETATDQPSTTEQIVKGTVVGEGRTLELRRSSRLHSTSPVVEIPVRRKSTVLEMGQEAKKISPRVPITTPAAASSKTRKTSNESEASNEAFVDAEEQFAKARMYPQVEITVMKSPLTDETFVSALEDLEDASREELDPSISEEVHSNTVQSTPRSTQNTLDNIPSSQPRPRSERSPLPLQPVPSLTPPPSFATSTPLSESKSTIASTQIPELADVNEASSDDDDEAPESISLSQSRSQALESQSKITQQTKSQASKLREKRRLRDTILATQKRQKISSEQKQEIPNSQPSEISSNNSGNTTDAPAPNQDHQAARINARNNDVALPIEILQAASSSWSQKQSKTPRKVPKKKRKVQDDGGDGVRVLEEMNVLLAPKAGKIGISKDKMIMRMGRGERRMFIGRFAK